MHENLERIAALIRAEKRRKCTELRLPLIHFEVLEYLSRFGRFENTPAAIAAHFGMTRGTMSQTVIALEKKGYIEKQNDVEDRRVIHVFLLPAGWVVLKKASLHTLYKKAESTLLPEHKIVSKQQSYMDIYNGMLPLFPKSAPKKDNLKPFLSSLSIYEIIEEIMGLIRAKEREFCAGQKIQWSHFQILEYLIICNKYSGTASAISEYLGMTRGTVSQSINLMEKHEYVVKAQDLKDKRVHHLNVLEKGKKFIELSRHTDFALKFSEVTNKSIGMSESELFVNELTALQKTIVSSTFGFCNSCCHFGYQNKSFYCLLLQENLSSEDSYKICQEHVAA